jgi:predicted MFS family arabinose efflux permease
MAVVALIVALCGNLVAALTDSLSVFFLSRVTGGLAEGCLLGLASGAAAVSGRTEHIFSTYKINLGLYAVLGLVVAPSLITQFGLLGGYGIIIVMNIVTLALALKAFPRQLEAAHNEQSELSNTDSGPSRLFSGAICAAIVVSIIGMMGLQSFIERIGVEIINLDSQMIGNILAAAAAVSILSPLLVMYLVKQGIGRALPFAIAAAFNISAVVLLGLNGTPLFYIIAVLALMPFMLFTQPYQVGLLAELDPTGRLAAAAPGFFGIGAAIGPPLAGLFSEHFGLLNITFLACGLTLIAYLVITFAAHRVDKQSI